MRGRPSRFSGSAQALWELRRDGRELDGTYCSQGAGLRNSGGKVGPRTGGGGTWERKGRGLKCAACNRWRRLKTRCSSHSPWSLPPAATFAFRLFKNFPPPKSSILTVLRRGSRLPLATGYRPPLLRKSSLGIAPTEPTAGSQAGFPDSGFRTHLLRESSPRISF